MQEYLSCWCYTLYIYIQIGVCVCVRQEELRILSHHLAVEKKKTETLLYAMLPQHVANQLREGRKVQAGSHWSGRRSLNWFPCQTIVHFFVYSHF